MTLQIFYNLQNHPTFHAEKRLVNLQRGSECCAGLSLLLVYGQQCFFYLINQSGPRPGGSEDQRGPTHPVRCLGGGRAGPGHRVVQERPEAHQRRLHLHQRLRQECLRLLPQECRPQHSQGDNKREKMIFIRYEPNLHVNC